MFCFVFILFCCCLFFVDKSLVVFFFGLFNLNLLVDNSIWIVNLGQYSVCTWEFQFDFFSFDFSFHDFCVQSILFGQTCRFIVNSLINFSVIMIVRREILCINRTHQYGMLWWTKVWAHSLEHVNSIYRCILLVFFFFVHIQFWELIKIVLNLVFACVATIAGKSQQFHSREIEWNISHFLRFGMADIYHGWQRVLAVPSYLVSYYIFKSDHCEWSSIHDFLF